MTTVTTVTTALSTAFKRPYTLLLAGLVLCSFGCTDDGKVPDCPQVEDYMSEDEELDDDWIASQAFETWREDSEEAGCLTPIGGSGLGGESGSR